MRLPSVRQTVQRDVDEELGFHLDMEMKEMERRGLTPEAATSRASCSRMP